MGRATGDATAGVRRALLRWYDRNRRDLPWRDAADPYRVWLSEVMLQQTRIAVVVPAYRRFVAAFPTLESLAAAGEDDVLAQWSGLGYYSRARALHRAARELVGRGGGFPSDYTAARRLPGVGAYTAAAVLSIAYGKPHAAVDGNVVRVLSRLFRLGLPDGRGEPHATVAASLLDRRRPGDWNQAVMELGETVCTPIHPDCPACPLAFFCMAKRDGAVDRHPPARPRRAVEQVETTLLVVRNFRGEVALERGAFEYLPRMWLPILADQVGNRSADTVAEIRHAITHRSFRIRVFTREVDAAAFARLLRQAPPGAERRSFSEDELARIGRSSLLQKALAGGSGERRARGTHR